MCQLNDSLKKTHIRARSDRQTTKQMDVVNTFLIMMECIQNIDP